MTNPFNDINKFHAACDQVMSKENYDMYLGLIKEEFEELQEAVEANDRVEQLDALIDILVVTLGAVRAGGFDGEGAWEEVMKTNFAKIDPDTGKVRKREDGKVLKPDTYLEPKLRPILERDFNIYKKSDAMKDAAEIMEAIAKEEKDLLNKRIESKLKKHLTIWDRFLYWLLRFQCLLYNLNLFW